MAVLLRSGRLASLGQLTAGVLHEINTPVQFVSDSVYFIRNAVTDLLTLVARYQMALRSVVNHGSADDAATRIADAEADADPDRR